MVCLPQVNVIHSNRRLAIVSARSDVCGASNSTWSDIDSSMFHLLWSEF